MPTTRGHLGVFGGAVLGDGTPLIGVQAETPGGSTGLGAALLTPAQAVEFALELLERATDPPMRETIRLRIASVWPELAGERPYP